MTSPRKSTIDTSAPARFVKGDRTISRLLERAGGESKYLVGGSVRDALLGGEPLDLDIAVDGPVAALATALDPDATLHPRFDTASVLIDGRALDLARTRSESYRRPGSLPEVEPAAIDADLSRRDFTINAMAVDLEDPGKVLDPFGGLDDLDRRVIRVIHPRSFSDDPTRALRAARYAARLGFDVDHRTADLLPAVDLATVSPDRVRSELDLIAGEATAVEAVRLASTWGLIELSDEGLLMLARAFELLETPAWHSFCGRAEVLPAILARDSTGSEGASLDYPGSPSSAAALAGRLDPVELLLARAGGAEWLDDWIDGWRGVELKVTGDDLIEAGIPRGKAVGVGLKAALVASLDDGISDREGQLAVALQAARSVARGAG